MPYIKENERKKVLGRNPGHRFETPGQLNYFFTWLITEYIKDRKLSYQTINDIIGALEGAKLEFYRRVAAPYEDIKIKENGDVY